MRAAIMDDRLSAFSFAWLGAADASVSVARFNGIEVARNLHPNPKALGAAGFKTHSGDATLTVGEEGHPRWIKGKDRVRVYMDTVPGLNLTDSFSWRMLARASTPVKVVPAVNNSSKENVFLGVDWRWVIGEGPNGNRTTVNGFWIEPSEWALGDWVEVAAVLIAKAEEVLPFFDGDSSLSADALAFYTHTHTHTHTVWSARTH